MSPFVTAFLNGALAVLALLVLAALGYAVLGRRFTDKIVAANAIGSLTVNIIAILALALGLDYVLDVSLVFALLSFLAVVVLCRVVTDHIFGKMRHLKQRAQAELDKTDISRAGSETPERGDHNDH